MRNLFLFFPCLALFAALPASAAEPFTDSTGLVVELPDGWNRDRQTERGAMRFAATFQPEKEDGKKYVLFQVVAGPSDGFDQSAWMEHQRPMLSKIFESVNEPFEITQRYKVAGQTTGLCTIAGTHEEGYPVRIRRCAVPHGAVIFVFTEYSYNNAHEGQDAPLAAMWDAVSFQEGGTAPAPEPTNGGGGEVDDGRAPDGSIEPGKGEPTAVEDKKGNLKLTLPPGWEVSRPAPDDATANTRFKAVRRVGESNVAMVEFFRIPRPGRVFTIGTPTDQVSEVVFNQSDIVSKWFGYENGRGFVRLARTDESKLMGGVPKSGQYRLEMITKEEREKIDEAETLLRRGQKIEVPEFPPRTVTGRVALLSPYLYVVQVYLAPSAAQSPQVLEEQQKLFESVEFFSDEPMPPHLDIAGEGTNTLEMRKEVREEKIVLKLPGRQEYVLDITFDLPPGLVLIKDRSKLRDRNVSAVFYGQDDRNNWVRIVMAHENNSRLGEQRRRLGSKKLVFEQWKSNWESKARGTRMRGERRVSLRIRGLGSGKGYHEVEGKVDGHRGTFTGYLKRKSTWRHTITIETRGKGDEVFEDAIEDLFKSMRIRDR